MWRLRYVLNSSQETAAQQIPLACLTSQELQDLQSEALCLTKQTVQIVQAQGAFNRAGSSYGSI